MPIPQKLRDRNQACVRMGTPHAWALATTAMLMERNQGRHDLLSGLTVNRGKYGKAGSRRFFEWWGIENKEEFAKTMQWLEYGGHRKEFERMGAYLASLDEQQLAEVQEKVKQNQQARQQVDIARKHYTKLGRKSILGWDYARYVFLCRGRVSDRRPDRRRRHGNGSCPLLPNSRGHSIRGKILAKTTSSDVNSGRTSKLEKKGRF